MSAEDESSESTSSNANVAVDDDVASPTSAEGAENDGVEVATPEFQSMSDAGSKDKKLEISRFADIKVTVSAELGRTNIPIERLLTLGSGSVLELNRAIDSPIELIAQGVPLACGEVVVVDDCFAIRITEVYPRNRRGEELPKDV